MAPQIPLKPGHVRISGNRTRQSSPIPAYTVPSKAALMKLADAAWAQDTYCSGQTRTLNQAGGYQAGGYQAGGYQAGGYQAGGIKQPGIKQENNKQEPDTKHTKKTSTPSVPAGRIRRESPSVVVWSKRPSPRSPIAKRERPSTPSVPAGRTWRESPSVVIWTKRPSTPAAHLLPGAPQIPENSPPPRKTPAPRRRRRTQLEMLKSLNSKKSPSVDVNSPRGVRKSTNRVTAAAWKKFDDDIMRSISSKKSNGFYMVLSS
ncbi:hypothetical protein K402DRAFT_407612 [Aulographum hederae CBS 113979]|uniref:Uncharacterized protein n=1 Tax=Aulographum hederae CBS 113979 TaxID=1176131 RepID=A0A6G1GNL7_9PEZI|nr:hypothetical protein K402DRAFT_407612 [Aulographum hederae CBS 113979]